MKFVRYQSNGNVSYGTLSGDTINEIDGEPSTGYSETGNTVALGDVQLLAPVTPGKVLAVGLNYRSHLGGGTRANQSGDLYQDAHLPKRSGGKHCAAGWR